MNEITIPVEEYEKLKKDAERYAYLVEDGELKTDEYCNDELVSLTKDGFKTYKTKASYWYEFIIDPMIYGWVDKETDIPKTIGEAIDKAMEQLK